MKILIFSEEYIKITKGMFVVWVNHSIEISKNHQLEILVNREHWALEELPKRLKENKNVGLKKLPFFMPITYVRSLLSLWDDKIKFRALKAIFGRFLNILISPLIILYFFFHFKKNKIDALYSHNGGWPAGQLCRWIIVGAKLAGIKNRIIIIHNYPGVEKYKIVRLIMRPVRLFQNWIMDICATEIVTVSDNVKDVLQLEFHREIKRNHNGIILDTPDENLTKVKWDHSGLVVGFVGALFPLKGPHVLLDAFRLVQVKCELALLGPSEPEYLKLLKEKAVLCTNKVSFLGFHQNVDSFFSQIDILVVPSIAFESFGMVVLEAMKHKKPVICSDFGGMKEIVIDGVTGFVVPAKDDKVLAVAITKLLKDKNLRQSMGEAGYERLLQDFTAEKMVERYFKLLRI
jgi:glycosyltransferase involved in cell wall biosynthesis